MRAAPPAIEPSAARDIERAPVGEMQRHKRLEQTAVCRDAEMEQFVGDDEILKTWVLFDQVLGEGDDAGRRAGTPFAGHPLDADNSRLGMQTLRPVLNLSTELLACVVTRL